jgi:hypothetical protein
MSLLALANAAVVFRVPARYKFASCSRKFYEGFNPISYLNRGNTELRS